MLLVQSGKKQS